MTDTAPATITATPTGTTDVTTDNADKSPSGVQLASSTGSDADPAPKTDTQNADWLAALDTEGRELATKKNWKDVNAALKSYSELEKLQSTRAADKPATYTADAYKFALPENAKDINYSEEFANGYRAMCAETGIDPATAVKVHDWYTKYATDSHGAQATAYATEVASQISATEGALVKAWGTQNNPVFMRNAELAQRAMNLLGVTDAMVEAGALVKHANGTTVANAQLFQMFAKIGQQMYAEDVIHGPAVANGKNPFDPASADMAAQSALIRTDPEKALLLISSLKPSEQQTWTPVLARIRARVKK